MAKEVRGFKVLVGGGLGAQPHLAITTMNFRRRSAYPLSRICIKSF
jgi:sulfite reductase beta subunit-like hemoprotein